MTVVLVNMPFAALERPSLALGILSAVLRREGIACDTLHANLLFADRIGLEPYSRTGMCKPQDLLGEWLFSPLLFPGLQDRDLDYMRSFVERNQLFRKQDPEELLSSFQEVRDRCPAFVDEIAMRILENHPMVVGCTSTFTQHLASIALLRRIKELAPETVTMLGGGNCEAEMGAAVHRCFPALDYVVSGEADALITPLIRLIMDKGSSGGEEEMAPGVLCPDHRIQGYPDSAMGCTGIGVQELDGLPIPDFDEYFSTLASVPKIAQWVKPGLPVESSRGCWWGQKKGCTFCGLNGRRKRFRPKRPETVLDELEILSSRYGVKNFETTDNIMDMGFYDTLLPMLKDRGAPYSLFYETKSRLERRHVRRLREAGVTWIQPGIESLDSRVLALMNKGCKAWHNIRLLKLCRQYGIAVGWNLLCDFPGEEDEWYFDLAGLFPLLHHLPVTSSMVRVRFDRFSQYSLAPERYGLDLGPCESYYRVYDLPEDDLMDIAYFFEDRRRRELNSNPLIRVLLERDGLKACRKAHLDWNMCSLEDAPPRLDFVDDGVEIQLVDTRSCATTREQTLTGAERAAFVLMADGIGRDALDAAMGKQGYTNERTQEALDLLVAGRGVLEIDAVWLSLALERPLPEMPGIQDFPGGLAGSGKRERDFEHQATMGKEEQCLPT